MKMTNRKSRLLSWLKSELRDEAIKATDFDWLKAKLWRWYYRAQNAEYEVNELILKRKSAMCWNCCLSTRSLTWNA
jgi:hypothetical protein